MDELSGNQGSAREMAGRTAELLRRYRQLVEKVTSAGEHMGNAKQGLDRKATGDPTQEEEQQAIIKLTEALKMTQRQARSQSQSQSRRSAQGNPSQMRGSQGGGLAGHAGPPDPGRPRLGKIMNNW